MQLGFYVISSYNDEGWSVHCDNNAVNSDITLPILY